MSNLQKYEPQKNDFSAVLSIRDANIQVSRAGGYLLLWIQSRKCRLRRPRKLLRKDPLAG
jgi:hypothetical protein